MVKFKDLYPKQGAKSLMKYTANGGQSLNTFTVVDRGIL